MVKEETLDDDTLRDQVERGDSDGLAAHQSIDDERPGLAENAGYGCAGLACDPVNAERHAGGADQCPNFCQRPSLIDDILATIAHTRVPARPEWEAASGR